MYDVVQAAVVISAVFDRQRIEFFRACKGTIERMGLLDGLIPFTHWRDAQGRAGDPVLETV